MVASVQIPKRIWIEQHDKAHDKAICSDVLVEMEDGSIYTALFVTMTYLLDQMELSHAITSQMPHTPVVRYAALETPHILLDELDRDTIEDTIDNLLAMDVFESLFTQVTEDESDEAESRTTSTTGTRATQEVAAVVLSDVLVVEEEG